MKKFLMTIVAAIAAVSVNAQIYVGGGLGLTSTSYDGNSTTTFKLLPEVGYNLDNKSAVGLALTYAQSGKGNDKVTAIGVKPYYRYAFLTSGKVSLLADGGFFFGNVEAYNGTLNKMVKTNDFQIGVWPGVAVAVSDKISFVSHFGFLGYETIKPDYDGAKSTDTFGFDLSSLNLTFGLYYNF